MKWNKLLNKKMMNLNFRSVLVWIMVPLVVLAVSLFGVIISSLAKDQVEENVYFSLSDTVTQTKFYMDNYMYELFDRFVVLENDKDLYVLKNQLQKYGKINYGSHYIDLHQTLKQILSSNGTIVDSIYINFNNGDFLVQGYVSEQLNFEFDYDVWKERYPDHQYYWVNLLQDDWGMDRSDVAAGLFRLYESPDRKIRGIILFTLKESFFENVLENPRIGDNGFLSLIGQDGDMIFREVETAYEIAPREKERILNSDNDFSKPEVEEMASKNKILIYDTIKLPGWKIVASVPKTEVMEYTQPLKYRAWLLSFVLAILVGIVSIIVAKMLAEPLIKLTQKVRCIQEENLDVIFDVQKYQEVAILNEGLGDMLSHIKELLRQVELEQERKRSAEMSVLQAQIKPHFLYNTLYSVKQLCDMGESHEASNMISALSCFYRIGISGGEEMITIGEELEHVKSYLYIQQLRYSDVFRYIIDCEEDIKRYIIPKLSLQPIVENAIYHGVKMNRRQGCICITGRKEGSMIHLEVHDDGPGFSEERLRKIQAKLDDKEYSSDNKSIGIKNVHKRIQIHFGDQYGIRMICEPNIDTCVSICFPAQERS